MRILFALPGFHRVNRGAEIALMSVARELAATGDDVTLIGSGPALPDRPYHYVKVPAVPREKLERLPRLPLLRGDTAWEEASFAPGLLARYRPADFDVTVTCSFPFTNLVLRRPVWGGKRPRHVFVTQNGDWPARSDRSEYRWFGCDGLVCINPDYYEDNRRRYRAALIPNGADLDRFRPGPGERERFGFDAGTKIVLMVSAMIPSKNVAEGIKAMAKVDDAMLVVAGDGPIRDEILALAGELLPGRFRQIGVPGAEMPALYRSVDAFLHLSRDESFGNVYVEALASGLPIVAYDLPRTRWILDDQASYAAGDEPTDVAAAIARALRGDARAIDARLERASRFGWPVIARQYREFFDQIGP